MNHIDTYDILWHILAANGRQEMLFGGACAHLARKAFCASATGSSMPIVYLEVPLLGEPRFDLQVCMNRDALVNDYSLPDEAPAHERDLLEWLVSPAGSDCRGVDIAFDLSARGLIDPQLIVLMRKETLSDAEGFFSIVGSPDGAKRYRDAEQNTPAGWSSWYTGLIPGRPGTPVRLDWFVDEHRLGTYAHDSAELALDLERVGYHSSPRQIAWCEPLLTFARGLNIQLDAIEDGTIGPVFGYNLSVGGMRPREIKESLNDGWMHRTCKLLEEWGLADERWQRLEELCLGKALKLPRDAGGSEQVALVCMPTFIKVRMTQDALLDAKAYVMCILSPLGEPERNAHERS